MQRGRLAVIRRGHIGDVILTEPVIRPLRRQFDHVTIYTDFPLAAGLLEIYDEIRPYSAHLQITPKMYELVLRPVYETYPGINHLDGYARCLKVCPEYRIPKIRSGFPRSITSSYGFIAPHTSGFVRSMRQWPEERFIDVAYRLQEMLGIPFVILRPEHTFAEMLSLIEHCEIFLGNDSGPAILAQCFGKKAFVIFGATRPDLVLLADTAVGLFHYTGCNGCKHFARHTDIECASPLCLSELTVDTVVTQMLQKIRPETSL